MGPALTATSSPSQMKPHTWTPPLLTDISLCLDAEIQFSVCLQVRFNIRSKKCPISSVCRIDIFLIQVIWVYF